MEVAKKIPHLGSVEERQRELATLRWLAIIGLAFLSGLSLFSMQLFGAPLVSANNSSVLGILILIISLFGFVVKGGKRITPISSVFLACTIFLGFPAVFTSFLYPHGPYESSLSLSIIFTLLALSVRKEKQWLFRSVQSNRLRNGKILGQWVFGIILFYSIYLSLYLFEPYLKALWRPVLGLFPTVSVLFAYLCLRRNRTDLFLVFASVGFIFILVYSVIAFSHFGRINLAAMLLGPVIAGSWLRPNWVFKVSIVVAMPFGLLWAAFSRSGVNQSLGIGKGTEAVLESGTGLGSVFAPYTTQVRVVQASDFFGVRPALDFFDQLVFVTLWWVPRDWWPSKPIGTGRVLVEEFEPQLLATGHSMAASIFGEFVFYAGIFGPLLGILCIFGVVRVLERVVFKSLSLDLWRSVLLLGVVIYMQAQLLTLVWGSIAGYTVRGVAALFGMLGLVFLMTVLKRLRIVVLR